MTSSTAVALDPLRQYRVWARVFFAVLAAVGLVAAAFAAPSIRMPSGIVLIAGVGASVAIFITLSLAVGRAAPWAIHAIAPVCVVVIGFGLIRTVAAFGAGTITLPLEVLGAIAVLTREHRPELLPTLEGGRRWMWLAPGGLALLAVLPYLGGAAFSGDLLVAGPDELTLTVEADCPATADPTAPIRATVSWSWAQERPFAPPTDGIVIHWYATIVAAVPDAGLAVLDHRVSDEAAIHMGSSGEIDTLLEPYRRRGSQFVDFVIARRGSDLVDGSIELDLHPSDASSPGGALELEAAYAHGDRWVKASSMATCSW